MEGLELVWVLCMHEYCIRAWTWGTMFGNVNKGAKDFFLNYVMAAKNVKTGM
jgi:hypothetical protein